MNFESSILKKETLSKTAAKEKESLIEDFSKLMEKWMQDKSNSKLIRKEEEYV